MNQYQPIPILVIVANLYDEVPYWEAYNVGLPYNQHKKNMNFNN